jgi:hypothetical protein
MSKDSGTPFPGPNCYTGTERERLDRMESKLDRLYNAMAGDQRMGTRGFADRLSEVEKHAAEHNRRLIFTTGFLAALVSAWELIRHKIFE